MGVKQTIRGRMGGTRVQLPARAQYGISGGASGLVNVFGYTIFGQPKFTMQNGKLTPTGYPNTAMLDFNNLIWTVYDSSGGGEYLPEPSIGAVSHFRTQYPLSQSGERAEFGQMPRTGSGACNCHVSLTGVSSMNPGDQSAWANPASNQSFIRVYTTDLSTFNFLIEIVIATAMPIDGAYDFPFTMPNDGTPFIQTYAIFSTNVPSVGDVAVIDVVTTFTPHS